MLHGIRRLVTFALWIAGAPAVWAQGTPITFSATGDIPYNSSEVSKLQLQIRNHNRYSPSEFLVHVGDMKGDSGNCNESAYRNVAAYLRVLAVPAYIVLGDNEWNNCGNPSQAFGFWMRYFYDFQANFCGAPPTEHQSVRRENWAFVSRGVLFLGIDLPGSPIYPNRSAWDARLRQNADWCAQQFAAKGTQVRAAVVFAQAGPGSQQNAFFTVFRRAAAGFRKPVLFLHGDGHRWRMDRPWPERNLLRVQVNKGGYEDPVQVTVNMDATNPFVFRRNPWSNRPAVYNAAPCVDAEAVPGIVSSGTANLRARASDDGDPGPLALTWSKTSGPGTVRFASARAATTTATFSAPGNYVLRLTAFDGALTTADEIPVQVGSVGEAFAGGPDTESSGLDILQSFPNPSRGLSTIDYALPFASDVQLEVYDVAGRVVRQLVANPLPAGRHQASWDGRNERGERAGSGVYFLRLRAGGAMVQQRLVLTR